MPFFSNFKDKDSKKMKDIRKDTNVYSTEKHKKLL